MSLVSGWCSQHGRPNHKGCRALLCTCDCHGTPVNMTRNRTAERVEFGAQSGPESAANGPGPTDHPAKDVTG